MKILITIILVVVSIFILSSVDFNVKHHNPKYLRPSEIRKSISEGKTSFLLESIELGKVDINEQDQAGYPPIVFSLLAENKEVTLSLLKHGADVNIKSDSGNTALDCLIGKKKLKMIEFLFENSKKINLNIQTAIGKTPIVKAIYVNSFLIVELLLSYGANPNTIDINGESPLDIAKKHNKKEIFKLLKSKGALFSSQIKSSKFKNEK